MFRELLLTMSV
jgi:hypothetical protein